MFSLEEKVENYLKEHGITKIFLANLLNISAPNLAAMFNGKRKMKSIELIIFARHFGLDIDFFSDVSGLEDIAND